MVQVSGLRETEVVDEVSIEQRVDSVNERMRPRSFKPDMTSQVVFPRSDRYKPAAGLKYDPGFLRIYMNLPEAADDLS